MHLKLQLWLTHLLVPRDYVQTTISVFVLQYFCSRVLHTSTAHEMLLPLNSRMRFKTKHTHNQLKFVKLYLVTYSLRGKMYNTIFNLFNAQESSVGLYLGSGVNCQRGRRVKVKPVPYLSLQWNIMKMMMMMVPGCHWRQEAGIDQVRLLKCPLYSLLL